MRSAPKRTITAFGVFFRLSLHSSRVSFGCVAATRIIRPAAATTPATAVELPMIMASMISTIRIRGFLNIKNPITNIGAISPLCHERPDG